MKLSYHESVKGTIEITKEITKKKVFKQISKCYSYKKYSYLNYATKMIDNGKKWHAIYISSVSFNQTIKKVPVIVFVR